MSLTIAFLKKIFPEKTKDELEKLSFSKPELKKLQKEFEKSKNHNYYKIKTTVATHGTNRYINQLDPSFKILKQMSLNNPLPPNRTGKRGKQYLLNNHIETLFKNGIYNKSTSIGKKTTNTKLPYKVFVKNGIVYLPSYVGVREIVKPWLQGRGQQWVGKPPRLGGFHNREYGNLEKNKTIKNPKLNLNNYKHLQLYKTTLNRLKDLKKQSKKQFGENTKKAMLLKHSKIANLPRELQSKILKTNNN